MKIHKYLTSNRSSYMLFFNKETIGLIGWDPEKPISIERSGNSLILSQKEVEAPTINVKRQTFVK